MTDAEIAKEQRRLVADCAGALNRMAKAIRASETGATAMTPLDASWMEAARDQLIKVLENERTNSGVQSGVARDSRDGGGLSASGQVPAKGNQ
jgi:hypothetical protein